MRLTIRKDAESVGQEVSEYVAQQINNFVPSELKPFFVLGLPTGSSPLPTYRNLITLHQSGFVSFKNVVTFNMDEYVGIPRDHAESYRTFMHTHFFSQIDIREENINLLDGEASDLLEECSKYEAKILKVGGIDLFLAGIGEDGHLAFNEPGSSLSSRTRLKTLAYDTILANARFFDNKIESVPKLALTVGIATIMEAREVIVIVTGPSKALVLAMIVENGINHMWTASVLQNHPLALIVCDEDSTLELRVKTVRYFKSIQKSQKGEENLRLKQKCRINGSNGI